MTEDKKGPHNELKIEVQCDQYNGNFLNVCTQQTETITLKWEVFKTASMFMHPKIGRMLQQMQKVERNQTKNYLI